MQSRNLIALVLLALPASAQESPFNSPGMQSVGGVVGQTTRFSREFNPAFGFAFDTFMDYLNTDADEGFDLNLRILEFNASAYVDPNAWAYVALVVEDEEAPALEEAAVEYIGFEGNSTLKAGLFFVDFGKQMQNHIEELRTIDRPLVLREYLGDELAGVGVQYNNWFAVTDEMPIRFSVAAFSNLLNHHHGDEEEGLEPELSVPERKSLDEFSFTGRLTALQEIGESSQLQYGLSTRIVPDFTSSFDTLETGSLDNVVFGGDITYGWTSDTGVQNFVAGAEVLVADGTLAVEVDDPSAPTTLTPIDDTAVGLYAYADYAWDQNNSAGVQYSMIDLPEAPDLQASEFDLYYTRMLNEFRRLRLGVTLGDSDLDGDLFRVYLQFTAFFGTHAHDNKW